jgi:hypothetical protein
MLHEFEQADDGYDCDEDEEDDVCAPQHEAAAGVTLEAAHAEWPGAVRTFCHLSLN